MFKLQLPVELLRAIFEEYLRLDLPVQTLLEVNRQWHTVALETQSLWRRLLLSADAIPASLRAGSVHACASEEQAACILKRSGTVTKLEVTFVLGPKEGETPTPEDRANLFKTVGHTTLHRISFLCVIVNPEMTLSLMTASLNNAFNGELPCLESLMIASAWSIGNLYDPLNVLMDIIERSSPNLESINLENVSPNFVLRAFAKGLWPRLTRITIRKDFSSLGVTIFSRFRSLEFLYFVGGLTLPSPVHWACSGSALNTQIDFPNLKWLYVGFIPMSTFVKLRMDRLHTMYIDLVGAAYPASSPPPGTLCFPALKELHVATIDPSLSCIYAPDLDMLCLAIPVLRPADADRVLKGVFNGSERMMKPRFLALRGPVHNKCLVVVLRSLPGLVSLELGSELLYSKTFWTKVTPPQGRSRAPLLPNLRYLVVDLHRSQVAQGEGLEMRVLLQKLIEGRRENDQYKNLLRLACKWREGAEFEEMVDPSNVSRVRQ